MEQVIYYIYIYIIMYVIDMLYIIYTYIQVIYVTGIATQHYSVTQQRPRIIFKIET